MLFWVILGLLLLASLLVLGRMVLRGRWEEIARRARKVMWISLALAAGLGGLLLLLGKGAWLWAALVGVVPWLLHHGGWVFRAIGLARMARRFGAGGRKSGGAPKMTRRRALEVLGLGKGASRETIIQRHRELIRKLHPDAGGSEALAQEINAARDLLLKG